MHACKVFVQRKWNVAGRGRGGSRRCVEWKWKRFFPAVLLVAAFSSFLSFFLARVRALGTPAGMWKWHNTRWFRLQFRKNHIIFTLSCWSAVNNVTPYTHFHQHTHGTFQHSIYTFASLFGIAFSSRHCMCVSSLAGRPFCARLNRNRCENDNPDQVFTQNRIGNFHAVFTRIQCSFHARARPLRRGRFNGPRQLKWTFFSARLMDRLGSISGHGNNGNSAAGVSAQTANNAANSNLLILCQDNRWPGKESMKKLPLISDYLARTQTERC